MAAETDQQKSPTFTGSWKMVKSENFEEFLAENGANWFIRKMASRASPSVVIEQSGDVFSIKTVTPVRTQEDAFTVGQPYEMDSMGGLTMQAVPSWDGQALLITFTPKDAAQKDRTYTARRQILDDGQLLLTLQMGKVTCNRWFQKTT